MAVFTKLTREEVSLHLKSYNIGELLDFSEILAGIDNSKWQGFAFGGGIDRILMVKYGIDDIRQIYSGDLRFVNQF